MTAPILILSVTFVGMLSAPDGATSSEPALLDRAEAAFREGMKVRGNPAEAQRHFREAASHYEALHQRGIDNADLDRNLGNSYLLAGDLPRAISAYRRGLRLNPADDTLRANLAYARGKVVYAEPGSLGRPAAEHHLPWLRQLITGRYFISALLLYTLGCLGITRWWLVRRTWPLGLGIAALAVSGLVAAGLVVEEWNHHEESIHPLVVIVEDGVHLHKGNGFAYPRGFDTPVNRGVEARLRFRRGEWLQVELAGGDVGWLPATKVLQDAP